MRCLNPRTVGFQDDGKTICWSPKRYTKEYATFQLPCGKCIECRLEYARQWAVRCVHESKMHDQNCFITLTYSDENLKNPKLDYSHFQSFMKRLRERTFRKFLDHYGEESWKLLDKSERKELYERIQIGFFVTGEYGDKFKRPHWHAIIFNWSPPDLVYKYTSDNGDRVCSSATLDTLWGQGITEVGSVTFQSAGYCARYAAKKLVHGNDGHEWEPISKKSQRNAIGKKFLEKYWRDVFEYGHVVLDNGQKSSIPRYYEKWLQKNLPHEWERYVTKLKADRSAAATAKDELERQKLMTINDNRNYRKGHQIAKSEVKRIIAEDRFKRLQKHLKGDI